MTHFLFFFLFLYELYFLSAFFLKNHQQSRHFRTPFLLIFHIFLSSSFSHIFYSSSFSSIHSYLLFFLYFFLFFCCCSFFHLLFFFSFFFNHFITFKVAYQSDTTINFLVFSTRFFKIPNLPKPDIRLILSKSLVTKPNIIFYKTLSVSN